MSEILRSPTTGKAIYLTPRSGSHSLALSAMQTFWPDIVVENDHPSTQFGVEEWWDGTNVDVALVVRNPVERFRSMCAHRPQRTLEQHLDQPVYGTLPSGNFVRYFRFEDQLDAAAEWLGLPIPLSQEDATSEADKPILTPEQEARVREIYAVDIALWESLQQ
jgi:hypothetical protein